MKIRPRTRRRPNHSPTDPDEPTPTTTPPAPTHVQRIMRRLLDASDDTFIAPEDRWTPTGIAAVILITAAIIIGGIAHAH